MINQEHYEIAKKFPKVSGFWFGSDFRKRKSDPDWTHEDIESFKTIETYNCLYGETTLSLPLFNPSFSKIVIFDIDDNQIGNMTVDKAVEIVRSYFGFGIYSEMRVGSNKKGAHLTYQFESEVFENAKKKLVNYFFMKHNVKLETEFTALRLPYSKDYRDGAVDENGQPIFTPAHLLAVFQIGQTAPTKIPNFLKPFNKHGVVVEKDIVNYDSGIPIEDIVISRGNRSDEMVLLALYAIGQNMSIEEYANLCDSKEDSSNPSRGLHDSHREQTIENIYNWAQENFNKEFERSESSQKIKEFLNESELELSDENFNNIAFILRRGNYLKDIKYSKVEERTIWGVQCMMEGILSMQDYHETKPTGRYKGKHAILNDGLAIAQSTVQLIAKYYGIKNWKKIWKIVKEVFLEPIALASGFYYSYCNVRHAVHYKISSVISLFNSLVKTLFSREPKKILRNYYNICSQVSNNINSNFSKILNYHLRAGPL